MEYNFFKIKKKFFKSMWDDKLIKNMKNWDLLINNKIKEKIEILNTNEDKNYYSEFIIKLKCELLEYENNLKGLINNYNNCIINEKKNSGIFKNCESNYSIDSNKLHFDFINKIKIL